MLLYRLNLQFFAADVGGGTGNQSPDHQTGGNNDPAGGNNDPGQGQHQQQGNQDAGNQAGADKTFTQDDVNNLIARETKKQQEKLLKQLGIEDFDNAKEGLEKFREWQESQKTEAQKQAERLQTLEQNYTQTTEENETLKAQVAAMKQGVKAESVEDVVTLAKNLVNDDIDINIAIKNVLEKYPHFSQEQQQEEKPPKWTTGQHQKQSTTELDKWINAFN